MRQFFNKNRILILASILLGLFLWKLPLYTQDGPNHKRVAIILSRLDQSPLENQVYQSNLGWFHTNSFFPLIYKPLAPHLSPDTYEKIFLGFFLFFLAVSYRFFLRVWYPENISLWVLILPFWFHPLVLRGFYNFIASLPFALLALATFKKGMETKKFQFLLAYLLFCWLIFLAHPFPLFVLLLIILLFALTHSLKNLKLSILYAIPPLLLATAGFLLSLSKSGQEGAQTPFVFMGTLEQPVRLLINNFVAFSIPQIIAISPFLLLLIGLMVVSLRRTPWKQKIFWFVLLMAFFYSPTRGSGGSHLNERFLPFVWAFLPVGLILNEIQLKRIRILLVGTALVMGIGTVWGMSRLDVIADSYREVLKSLPSPARLYSISFENQGPAYNYSPLYHFWALVDDKKIIFHPYVFASRELFPLSKKILSSPTYFPATAEDYPMALMKKDFCQPTAFGEVVDCSSLKRLAFERIFRSASYYDYWLLSDPPSNFLQFLQSQSHLTKVAEQGTVTLWHFQKALPFDPPLSFEVRP